MTEDPTFYELVNVQILNNIKRQLFGILNLGLCDLFDICNLLFEIFYLLKPHFPYDSMLSDKTR
jgi:hypothetical protein